MDAEELKKRSDELTIDDGTGPEEEEPRLDLEGLVDEKPDPDTMATEQIDTAYLEEGAEDTRQPTETGAMATQQIDTAYLEEGAEDTREATDAQSMATEQVDTSYLEEPETKK